MDYSIFHGKSPYFSMENLESQSIFHAPREPLGLSVSCSSCRSRVARSKSDTTVPGEDGDPWVQGKDPAPPRGDLAWKMGVYDWLIMEFMVIYMDLDWFIDWFGLIYMDLDWFSGLLMVDTTKIAGPRINHFRRPHGWGSRQQLRDNSDLGDNPDHVIRVVRWTSSPNLCCLAMGQY